MRKLIMLAALLFIAAVPAHAQSDTPSAEIFGGYSYLGVDIGAGSTGVSDFFSNRESFHGVGFNLSYNPSSKFGLVTDFSYNRKTINVGLSDLKLSNFYFLFGPRVYARSKRVTGFAHALVGGTQEKVAEEDEFGSLGSVSQTNFALGFGGGVDIGITDSIAIRAIQFDYLPTRAFGEWGHNVRAQVGITLRLH